MQFEPSCCSFNMQFRMDIGDVGLGKAFMGGAKPLFIPKCFNCLENRILLVSLLGSKVFLQATSNIPSYLPDTCCSLYELNFTVPDLSGRGEGESQLYKIIRRNWLTLP